MRSTLFYIPHEVFGIPLFGFGIALGVLVAGLAVWTLWLLLGRERFARRPQGQRQQDAKADERPAGVAEILAGLPMWGIIAAVIVFVLPGIEQTTPSGEPIGLPIRGYGVLVLLGFLAGVGISILRGRQLGLHDDTIIGLGFSMMFGGVFGARLFYVVQKWDEFAAGSFSGKLFEALKLTEGGLVIYGGVIGGLVAGGLYCYWKRLAVPAVADLVAPGFLVGLAFGRVGCLLHGCCFGGLCTADLPTIQFPRGSVPYQSQLGDGSLLGIQLKESQSLPAEITSVEPDSPAAAFGLQAGQRVSSIDVYQDVPPANANPALPPPLVARVTVDGKLIDFTPASMPAWSRRVHPSQIYASINAFLLCALIWVLQPLPRRDGVAFLVAILLYGCSRFLLEWVRSDESGQLGTALTISQLVSIAAVTASLLGLLALTATPARRSWKWRGAANVPVG